MKTMIAVSLLLFTLPVYRANSMDDIRESVFRYQMAALQAESYCLAAGTDPGGHFLSPNPALLSRFSDKNVKDVSECTKGYIPDVPTKGQYFLSVDAVQKVDDDDAVVRARIIQDILHVDNRFYKLRFSTGKGWVVTSTEQYRIHPAQ